MQEVYASELVLADEHISKWVCLKTAGSVTRFRNTVIGYLNNYSINGIRQTSHMVGNYRFNDNPREQDFLPFSMQLVQINPSPGELSSFRVYYILGRHFFKV